ncbi:MAG: opacity protein-like surface antigen [Bacteriovoracaceae bacterium]|jgi:opacity protein-like surface antigen
MKKLLIGLTLISSISTFANCNVKNLNIVANEEVAQVDYNESIKDHLEMNMYGLGYRFDSSSEGMNITLGYQDRYGDQVQIEVKKDEKGKVTNQSQIDSLEAKMNKHISRRQMLYIEDSNGVVLNSSKRVSKTKLQKEIITDILLNRLPRCENLDR